MHKDFLTPEREAPQTQAGGPKRTTPELEDLEYAGLLNRSDDRILRARGGVLPPNPLAPKEPPTPGSEAEYELLLSKMDPRLLWERRKR